MKARRLENVPLSTGSETGKVAVINQEMCIGCGVCAYKCPTQSIMMKRKEVFQEPPLNPIEHGQMIMADLQAARVKGR